MSEKKPKTCPFKFTGGGGVGSCELPCSEDCALYIEDRAIEKAGHCAFFWLTLKLQDIGGLLESIKDILNMRFGSP